MSSAAGRWPSLLLLGLSSLSALSLSSCRWQWGAAAAASPPPPPPAASLALASLDEGSEGACAADDQRASSERCEESLQRPPRKEHAMLQLKQSSDVTILTDAEVSASAGASARARVSARSESELELESDCTPSGEKAFVHPHNYPCCRGLRLHRASGKCMANFMQEETPESCTGADEDPYDSGSFVACCKGLSKKVSDWTTYKDKKYYKGYWYYLCIDNSTTTVTVPSSSSSTSSTTPSTTSTTLTTATTTTPSTTTTSTTTTTTTTTTKSTTTSSTTAPTTASTTTTTITTTTTTSTTTTTTTESTTAVATGDCLSTGALTKTKIFEWNVYYKNKDTSAIASVVADLEQTPDVIGFCELTVVPMSSQADALTEKTGRTFALQPGRSTWIGYGTDIYYATDKWEALTGIVRTASACASEGGPRAANGVVLKEIATGNIMITGGTHLSYCANGCDSLHQCELGNLYDVLEELKADYPTAYVVWMGDMNRAIGDTVLKDLLKGKIGSRSVAAVDDVTRAESSYYSYSGGSSIDHIFSSTDNYILGDHGNTGQGVTGYTLEGSDHFPVFSVLTFCNA